jgi:SAM-dependent methyltransferase
MPDAPVQIPEDWYSRSFRSLYPVIYAHRTVEAAEREAAFAAGQLALGGADQVLDLCCGNGRHMAHLLRRVRRVTGLDYSRDLLVLARETLGDHAGLVRADMRAIPFAVEVFEAVVNFFTSFGYFIAAEENARVVHEVARVLKPGGRFFIDYLNAAHVEQTLVPESFREYKEYGIQERRWIDGVRRRVNKIITVRRGGSALGSWGESVQLYEEGEFRALLSCGGLRVDRAFGDYDGTPPASSRPRMIVVGHKE